MARLVVSEGPEAGERIEFADELVLGREGDFGTEDEELSRRHAILRTGAQGLEVEDLGSLNGTFVNGRKIDGPAGLRAGDHVRVGRTVLEVQGAIAKGETVASSGPAETHPPEQPAPAPSAAFGTYAAPETSRRRGRNASRLLTSTLLSFGAVIATAVALVLYFAQH